MRLRAAREVWRSRLPIIFRVTGGSSSTASQNATITLSACRATGFPPTHRCKSFREYS